MSNYVFDRLTKAKGELEVVMNALRLQQNELNKVEAHISQLKKTYNESVLEKERLERKITQTAVRLKRSTKLTAALADKYQRWCDTILVSKSKLCSGLCLKTFRFTFRFTFPYMDLIILRRKFLVF